MQHKIGFDNAFYLSEQSRRIKQRVEKFDKLYLEFGGKLFDDFHASRVLPGFDANCKVKLLAELKDESEIILCISAVAIEQNKIRADLNITYDYDVLRLIDNLRKMGLYISAILITQYSGQNAANVFRNKLENRGENVYVHSLTKGYPSDVDIIVSDEGYGANEYIPTTRKIVVVTAPGPSSGKLATCLSQLYHEQKMQVNAGYAKFETFPVWNVPLQHPLNIAYEAATADLKDVNMLDPFHLEAYGVTAVNYNRDIEVFPVVQAILKKITGKSVYKSPTDMGVNMIGACIVDDDVVCEASKQEIIRRWYNARCEAKQGHGDNSSVQRIEMLMSKLDLHESDRKTVAPALEKSKSSGRSAVALELFDGNIITGKSSELMNDTASVVLNTIKTLAGIDDAVMLISPDVLEPVVRMKESILGSRYPVLKLEEVLQVLAISAAGSETARLAMEQIPSLRGCNAHCSHLICHDDASTFLKLGILFTCEPEFPTENLYFR